LAENMGKRENDNGMEGREWPKLIKYNNGKKNLRIKLPKIRILFVD
jgi:hypothetical protein